MIQEPINVGISVEDCNRITRQVLIHRLYAMLDKDGTDSVSGLSEDDRTLYLALNTSIAHLSEPGRWRGGMYDIVG